VGGALGGEARRSGGGSFALAGEDTLMSGSEGR